MKFLIINTDYRGFLQQLYAQHPGLEERSYDEQMQARNDSLFGVADFYSHAFRELGHWAEDIHANNEPLQRAWAREHDLTVAAPGNRWRFRLRRGVVPWVWRERDNRWFWDVLAAQIEHIRPDVILNEDVSWITPSFLRRFKQYTRLIVAQHAATALPEGMDYGVYDFAVSSFSPTVSFFRGKGVPAELWRLGFEPRVLGRLHNDGKKHDITFIGSFQSVHAARQELIERVCTHFPQTRIWRPKSDVLPPESPIHRCHIGEAWGLDMYQILGDSRVIINHHGSIPPFANNMRLYEATGVGSLLLTDWKENLHEMFEPGLEVATYRTTKECLEKIAYYLEHTEDRERIARAGQERTLHEHTYRQRMQQLLDLIEKRI